MCLRSTLAAAAKSALRLVRRDADLRDVPSTVLNALSGLRLQLMPCIQVRPPQDSIAGCTVLALIFSFATLSHFVTQLH